MSENGIRYYGTHCTRREIKAYVFILKCRSYFKFEKKITIQAVSREEE